MLRVGYGVQNPACSVEAKLVYRGQGGNEGRSIFHIGKPRQGSLLFVVIFFAFVKLRAFPYQVTNVALDAGTM